MRSFLSTYKYLWIFVLALFAYLGLMDNTNVWTDEIFSLRLLGYSWGEMFHLIITEDGHPPLFYILLRLWMSATDYTNIFWARLFPMMWIFALALLGPFPIKRLFDAKTGFYFSVMALFMPTAFYLGTDIRMYAMGAFLITAALTYAALIVRENHPSDWVKFFLLSLAGMYTHYLVTLFMGAIYAVLFFQLAFKYKKNIQIWKRFFTCAFLTALCFGPWFCIALSQANNMYSHWAPNVETTIYSGIPIFMPFLHIGYQPILTALFVAFLAGLQFFIFLFFITNTFADNKNTTTKTVLIMLLITSITILAAFLISFLWRPILAPRYTFLLFGIIWLVYAVTLVQYKKLLPIFLIASICLTPIGYAIRHETVFDPMRLNLLSALKQQITPETNFICTDLHTCFFLIYYLPEHKRLLLSEKEDQWILKDLLFNHQPTPEQLINNPLFMLAKTTNCAQPLKNKYSDFEKFYCFSELDTDQKTILFNKMKQVVK